MMMICPMRWRFLGPAGFRLSVVDRDSCSSCPMRGVGFFADGMGFFSKYNHPYIQTSPHDFLVQLRFPCLRDRKPLKRDGKHRMVT